MRPNIVDLADTPILDVWRLGQERPGVIGLYVGESDLPSPSFVNEAAIRSLRDGHTFYTANRGIRPLRDALARYLARTYGVEVRTTVWRSPRRA